LDKAVNYNAQDYDPYKHEEDTGIIKVAEPWSGVEVRPA
jgi:hypothetical protein